MPRILLADTETTGVGADAEICELAFIEVDLDLNEICRFSSLVKPNGPISASASGASGITNRMVEDAPPIESVLAQFGPGYFQDVTMVAHSAQFDHRMLKHFWAITSTLCTLRAARTYFPGSPDHKLQTLRYHLDIEIDAGAHRAMADVEVMAKLLPMLITESGCQSFGAFLELEARAREVAAMPWGKHRGTPLKELPRGYVGWLLGLDDLDEDLKRSLQLWFR